MKFLKKINLNLLLVACLSLVVLPGCATLSKLNPMKFFKSDDGDQVSSSKRGKRRGIASNDRKPRKVRIYRSAKYFKKLKKWVRKGKLEEVSPGVYREVGL